MAAPLDAPWNNNALSDANLGAVTVGHGTSFPATWEVGRIFLRTDEAIAYFNSGTEGTPVWSSLGGLEGKTFSSDGIAATGDTVKYGGTDWERLAIGTNDTDYLGVTSGQPAWKPLVTTQQSIDAAFSQVSAVVNTIYTTTASITLPTRTGGKAIIVAQATGSVTIGSNLEMLLLDDGTPFGNHMDWGNVTTNEAYSISGVMSLDGSTVAVGFRHTSSGTPTITGNNVTVTSIEVG